jgi:hypothetical protein
MLLIDGVRYHLHKFEKEEEFEDVVEEHSKDIFRKINMEAFIKML